MHHLPQQQQQQQQQQMFNISPNVQQSQPTTNITTEQIQKYLDENKQLILAIMEYQNLGKLNDCAQYQAQLQKNLMYLAAIADAQPPAPTGPVAQPQIPTQSTTPQGQPMQHPQHAISQQQQGSFGSRLPFTLQSHEQQQSPHIQMQQSMVGAMGMRMGGPIQTGPGSATHLMMDARSRQDGSDQAGFGGANRD